MLYLLGKEQIFVAEGNIIHILAEDQIDQVKLPELTTIAQIFPKTGDNGFYAVTTSGKLYAWGCNILGINDEFATCDVLDEPLEIILPQNDKIVFVASGMDHILLLTDKGEVYGIGDNTDQQLGLDEDWIYTFTKLPIHDVMKVAAGDRHSVFYTKDNKLIVTGQGSFGQLGFTSINNRRCMEVPLPQGFGTIVQITAFQNNTLLVIDTGEVYICGQNDKGQLGNNKHRQSAGFKRIKFHTPEHISWVKHGHAHIIAGTNTGELIGWGNNNLQQLQDTDDEIITPQKFNFKVLAAICGSESLALLTQQDNNNEVIYMGAELKSLFQNDAAKNIFERVFITQSRQELQQKSKGEVCRHSKFADIELITFFVAAKKETKVSKAHVLTPRELDC